MYSVGGLRTVERFTRIDKDTIQWDVTANNPAMFTNPWTATVMLRSSADQIFEMACHEENDGLAGALRGERVLEREAVAGARAGSK